jgi:hypothetical protein
VSGTAATALGHLGFGVRLFDFDNDGHQDLVVANGHVYDNGLDLTPPAAFEQPPSLFRGLGGGRFTDVSDRVGEPFQVPRVGRGLALADLDDDGDLDLVLCVSDGRPRIFENAGGEARPWATIRLRGTRRDSTAIGGRVTVRAGGERQIGEVRSGAGYLSQSDFRLFFGLRDMQTVDELRIRWPGGAEQSLRDLPAGLHWTIPEAAGR